MQLLSAHRVHRAPNAASGVLEDVPAQRPITGERTTLPVIARKTTHDGISWLRVMLPGRPNSSSGWIAAAANDRSRARRSVRARAQRAL